MNQNMWRIVPNSSDAIDKRYLYHFLTMVVPTFVRQFSESTRGFFKKSDFRAIRIPMPDLDDQREIAQVADVLESKLALHRRKHVVLGALFGTLLHQLMSGQLRLNDIDLSNMKKAVI